MDCASAMNWDYSAVVRDVGGKGNKQLIECIGAGR
jgi:hypothetical protein